MNIKYSRYSTHASRVIPYVLGILVLFVVTILTSSCITGSGSTVKSSELNTTTKMSMTYENFTGYRQTKVKVKENTPIVIRVDFVTESGELDAYIARDNNLELSSYEGNNVPTSSFTVTLSEAGIYTIRIDAKNHTGSFSFSWGKLK